MFWIALLFGLSALAFVKLGALSVWAVVLARLLWSAIVAAGLLVLYAGLRAWQRR